MKDIPRSKEKGERAWDDLGHWFPVSRADGRISAMLNCPDCGQTASLAGHEIDAIGVVTPSLVCPAKGCAFHEFVRLVGWTPQPSP